VGAVRFGIPEDLASDLVQARGLQAAVETGTYRGDSARFLRSLCPRVWSIEISAALHAAAAAKHAGVPGLELLQGDSAELLPDLLAGIDEPALFWLDGHAMPGVREVGERQCPVIAEISAINASAHGREACILIDDAVLFLAAPQFGLRPAEWPTMLEIVDLLRTHPDRHVTVLDDVLIAGPPEIRRVVDGWWGRVIAERGGTANMVPLQRLNQACNPTPATAARRLASSLLHGVQRRR